MKTMRLSLEAHALLKLLFLFNQNKVFQDVLNYGYTMRFVVDDSTETF